MNNFIEEILNHTLPKLRAEYGGFSFSRPFISQMFERIYSRYHERLQTSGINPSIYGVSPHEIIKYICGWHYAYAYPLPPEARNKLMENQSYCDMLVGSVTEEIFVLENIKTSASRIINEYNPIYCRFNVLLDHMLSISVNARKDDSPRTFLTVMRLFEKAFLKLKGVMMLVSRGLEPEAIVVWRSLHELECVIAVLCKYDDSVIREFEAFDRFSVERDQMDEQTKAEYDEHIKRYAINEKNNNEVDHFENYAWMGAIPGLELTKWNFNFRFLEDLAGMADKYKEYQVACDASHMNAKILKWNKQRLLEFAVRRCFNSLLFILSNYISFLGEKGIKIDNQTTGKMMADLRSIIDIYLGKE